MSEHEPECWIVSHANPLNGCICTELRACVKRVRDEYATWHPSAVHHCCVDVQTEYARGLDAALEAVASLEPVAHIHRERALAAIDALMEKT